MTSLVKNRSIADTIKEAFNTVGADKFGFTAEDVAKIGKRAMGIEDI